MSNDKSDLVWHYTSLDALKSIVEKQYLRSTRSDFLNDSEELIFGMNKMIEICEEKQSAAQNEFDQCSKKDNVISEFNEIDKKLRLYNRLPKMLTVIKDLNTSIYITSFSHDRDHLPQWTLYANDGRGVAIGFSKSALLDTLERSHECPRPNRNTPGYALAINAIYHEKNQETNKLKEKTDEIEKKFY